MSKTAIETSDLDRTVGILAESRNILFITGAGISADSGLPTYRGIGGLYNAEHPEEGLDLAPVGVGQPSAYREVAAQADLFGTLQRL
jgi:NAD-dependent deacetylase